MYYTATVAKGHFIMLVDDKGYMSNTTNQVFR